MYEVRVIALPLLILVSLLLAARSTTVSESAIESFSVTPTASPLPAETTLLVTGDVMLGRFVNMQAVRKNDFFWPWQNMADLVSAADLAFINLESPIIKSCPVTAEGMKFCGDIRHIAAMKQAGVDIASLANNHAENYGVDGFQQTKTLLNEQGIATVGTGSLVVQEVRGTRFGFLGYNDVETQWQHAVTKADPGLIQKDIIEAKQAAAVVAVMFHWGGEYHERPTQRQQELAYAAIDAGADLVLGNHPHWVQTTEEYNGKLIVYSHGNFIFDQNWSRKTSEGIVGKYTFTGSELTGVEFVPVIIEHNAQPRVADEEEKGSILSVVERAQ
ncbi:MAG: CapA family protein [Candidatus Andersenbacteria bacterium]